MKRFLLWIISVALGVALLLAIFALQDSFGTAGTVPGAGARGLLPPPRARVAAKVRCKNGISVL